MLPWSFVLFLYVSLSCHSQLPAYLMPYILVDTEVFILSLSHKFFLPLFKLWINTVLINRILTDLILISPLALVSLILDSYNYLSTISILCSVNCRNMNWRLSVHKQRDISALRAAEWTKLSLFLEKQVTLISMNYIHILHIKLLVIKSNSKNIKIKWRKLN